MVYSVCNVISMVSQGDTNTLSSQVLQQIQLNAAAAAVAANNNTTNQLNNLLLTNNTGGTCTKNRLFEWAMYTSLVRRIISIYYYNSMCIMICIISGCKYIMVVYALYTVAPNILKRIVKHNELFKLTTNSIVWNIKMTYIGVLNGNQFNE